jgi:basic amino acid/polyamine antiporter, APA family
MANLVTQTPTLAARPNALARKLHLTDYFSLAFGVMVGVGWLVVMDDWLARGGPVGALLGFAIGAAMLLPVGWVYGQLVRIIPDAAGEVAYTAKVFPQIVSYWSGWVMLLAYFIVCPYEAVAIGKIAGYLFPKLNSLELYRLNGYSIYLPHLLLGLALTTVFTFLNYRGIQMSARFLRWTTFAVLLLVALFATAGLRSGSLANFRPAFSHTPLVSILLVWQIVPYFMTGFDAVGKCAEEANPEFKPPDFSKAVILAIVVGAFFYSVIIASVSYAVPWQSITGERFATAVAFERALKSSLVVKLIMGTALISLLKIFNANLLTASRLLFAMGRRHMVNSRLARVHPVNQTPSVAVISIGVAIGLAIFLGNAILVPISEVGSVVGAFGWMMACLAYFRLSPSAGGRSIAAAGALVTLLMVLLKLLPFVPGHFSRYEWLALFLWCALGALVKSRGLQPSKLSSAAL